MKQNGSSPSRRSLVAKALPQLAEWSGRDGGHSYNPPMATVHLRYSCEFCAAYRLARPDWSEARNQEVYGVCASPHGHGHNYQLAVTVRGEVDVENGMVMDYMQLQSLVQENIVSEVDHLHLNQDVPWLQGIVTTSENLLQAFWPRIAAALPQGVRLDSLSLQESRDCTALYFGPDHD